MSAPKAPASRNRRAVLGALATAPALATPALAQGRIRWRMATSWPKNLPGPGMTAAFLARRIAEMSGGRFEIDVFAGGEIVPALQVFDAVATGTVEMGHSAALYWTGKMPAAAFFTTVPFGPGPVEHQAWLERFGGQAVWDALYAPFGVLPRLAGNTGPSMGGWFKRPIATLSDVKGLRLRVTGIGADVWQAIGATPLAIAAGDILPSLSSGAIDGVEFLAPVNDRPLGLVSAAKNYYAPGFNKPNGAAEALFHRPTWETLPPDFRAMLDCACAEAHARGLADAEADNAAALVDLLGQGVQLQRFPADVLAAARQAAEAVVETIGAKDAAGARVLASFRAARAAMRPWRRVGLASAAALTEP